MTRRDHCIRNKKSEQKLADFEEEIDKIILSRKG